MTQNTVYVVTQDSEYGLRALFAHKSRSTAEQSAGRLNQGAAEGVRYIVIPMWVED